MTRLTPDLRRGLSKSQYGISRKSRCVFFSMLARVGVSSTLSVCKQKVFGSLKSNFFTMAEVKVEL